MRKRFAGIWRQNDGIRVSAIRVNRLPYALAYFFELTLFAVLNRYVPRNSKILFLSEWDFAYAFHMIGSLVIILLWNERFRKLIYISASILLLGLVPALVLPVGPVQIAGFVVAMTGLGCVASCARCGFAYGTNNSEKAFGLFLAYFSDKTIRILRAVEVKNIFLSVILPFALFAALFACMYLFKESELEYVRESSKKDAKGLYWALAYYIVYFMVDGKMVSYGTSIEYGFFSEAIIGTIAGIVVLFLILFVFRLNSYHAWNIFFLAVVITFLSAALTPIANTLSTYFLFGNFNKMGWVLALYFMACAQKRFASIRLLKISTVIYVVLSPLSQYSDTILEVIFDPNDGSYDIALAIYFIIIIVMFLMLLPYSYRYLFSSEWISQMSKPDMEIISENIQEVDEFEKWNLSPRQKEVAALLLAGKTRRQISGELKLSESTVKLHTSELYKKLNINSRVELFRIFGAKPESEDENDLLENE